MVSDPVSCSHCQPLSHGALSPFLKLDPTLPSTGTSEPGVSRASLALYLLTLKVMCASICFNDRHDNEPHTWMGGLVGSTPVRDPTHLHLSHGKGTKEQRMGGWKGLGLVVYHGHNRGTPLPDTKINSPVWTSHTHTPKPYRTSGPGNANACPKNHNISLSFRSCLHYKLSLAPVIIPLLGAINTSVLLRLLNFTCSCINSTTSLTQAAILYWLG